MVTLIFVTTTVLVIILRFAFEFSGEDAGLFGLTIFWLTWIAFLFSKIEKNDGQKKFKYEIFNIFSRWPSLNRFYVISAVLCFGITIIIKDFLE